MADDKFEMIEMKIAYQEHTLETLNEVVIEQQKQIDKLQRTVTVLTDRVKSLGESSGAGPDGGSEKPPHY